MPTEALPYEVLPPPQTRLWRYTSLARLLDLLRTQSLFLSRVDLLEDPFEGTFSEGSIEKHAAEWGEGGVDHMTTLSQWAPCRTFVSCWHASDCESAGLWHVYGSSEGSIAIQSTVAAVQRAFPDVTERQGPVLLNQGVRAVQYIDYQTEHPQLNDLMGPMCFKRKAFAYEREVRVIRQELPSGPARNRPGGSALQLGPPPDIRGVLIRVELADLLETLYVAPTSPAWVLESIAETMSRFGCGAIPCRRSTLDTPPATTRFGV